MKKGIFGGGVFFLIVQNFDWCILFVVVVFDDFEVFFESFDVKYEFEFVVIFGCIDFVFIIVIVYVNFYVVNFVNYFRVDVVFGNWVF